MSKNGEIICGDSLEVLKTFGDNHFDMCFADPPYNAKNIGTNARVYEGQQMQLPTEEYKEWCGKWFKEARRVSKTLVLTPGIANVCYYPQPDWILCWHKPAAVSFNRYGGFNAWEPIIVYGKIAKGKRLGQDYLLINTLNFSKGIEKEHPCPKPQELIDILVDRFSNEGDKVLDPFCGSGTTGVSCKKMDRTFTGVDIIERYCEISRERFEKQLVPLL